MATKKWTLFAALLLCLAACSDPETATSEPQGPNPTPNTVYEPIDVEIMTKTELSMLNGIENSYSLCPTYNPLTNWWDWYSLVYVFFPESDVCKNLSDVIYFKLQAKNPHQLYIHWEHENNGWNKMPEKNSDYCHEAMKDYLFQHGFALATPDYGTQQFKLIICDFESKKFYITREFEFCTFEDRTCYIK